MAKDIHIISALACRSTRYWAVHHGRHIPIENGGDLYAPVIRRHRKPSTLHQIGMTYNRTLLNSSLYR